jgi:hypothetical protein
MAEPIRIRGVDLLRPREERWRVPQRVPGRGEQRVGTRRDDERFVTDWWEPEPKRVSGS